MSYPLLPPEMEPDDLAVGHWLEEGGHDLPDDPDTIPFPEPDESIPQMSDLPELPPLPEE